MNDQFLNDARPRVRQAFVNSLYQRLQDQRRPIRPNRRLGFALIVLSMLLVGAVVWQFLTTNAHFVTEINGITINEMNYQIIDAQDFEPVERNPNALSRPGPAREPENVFDIMARLPYKINLPTWLPEGIKLNELNYDDVGVREAFFHLEWYNEDGLLLGLMVHEIGKGMEEALNAAPDTWTQVEINGIDAVLVRGDFRVPFASIDDYVKYFADGGTWRPGYWDNDLGLRLMWSYEGVFYQLSSPAFCPPFSCYSLQKLTEEELLKITESMIPN